LNISVDAVFVQCLLCDINYAGVLLAEILTRNVVVALSFLHVCDQNCWKTGHLFAHISTEEILPFMLGEWLQYFVLLVLILSLMLWKSVFGRAFEPSLLVIRKICCLHFSNDLLVFIYHCCNISLPFAYTTFVFWSG